MKLAADDVQGLVIPHSGTGSPQGAVDGWGVATNLRVGLDRGGAVGDSAGGALRLE